MRATFLLLLCSLAALHCGGPTSPIVGAAREGRVEEIRRLMKQGADPDQFAGVNSWTPLLHAIHKNQLEAVIALSDAGADVNRASPAGLTPLMMAAGYGYEGILKSLLGKGADPRQKDGKGRTALDYAITGIADIDRFTLGRCQADCVRVLRKAAPDQRPAEKTAAKWTGCESLLAQK